RFRAVLEAHAARMLARFVVGIVGRDLERFAEPGARQRGLIRKRANALVRANAHPAPRPLDEVARRRLEQPGRDALGDARIAVEQRSCNRLLRSQRDAPTMANEVCHEPLCQNVTEYRLDLDQSLLPSAAVGGDTVSAMADPRELADQA